MDFRKCICDLGFHMTKGAEEEFIAKAEKYIKDIDKLDKQIEKAFPNLPTYFKNCLKDKIIAESKKI